MKNKKKGTLILITTAASAVLLAAVVVGLLLFKHYFGKSEPVQYKNQYKISEKVWEMEPDADGKRHVVVGLKCIPEDEIPDNINPKSHKDMKKLYTLRTYDFFKRNSIDYTDRDLVFTWTNTSIFIHADENFIRRLAEDELVEGIGPWGNSALIND